MKLLLIKIKLTYYTLLSHWEDLVNKLMGRKSDVTLDGPVTQIERQRENVKLARGIKKLTARMYGADGKLQRWAKRKDVNLFNTIPGPKKTALEKIEEARLIQKNLENPTDVSKTNESMVKHNVNNAPRYVLEKDRRTLSKEKFRAIKDGNTEKALKLDFEIQGLNRKIAGMK